METSSETIRRIEREETRAAIEWRKIEPVVTNNVLIRYPKLANHPKFLAEIIEKARQQGGNPGELWMIERARELGINLLGGGSGGRSAKDKADSIRSFSAAIINAAGRFGVDLTPETVAYIATVADDQNFSMDQLNDVILNQTNWEALKPGDLTANVDKIKQSARSYLVPLSDATVKEYSTKIASGQSSFEAIESLLKQQAKMKMPWMANAIDQGLSPSDLLAGSRDQIASSLGINAAEVDFTTDRFMNMVTVADEKGNTRLATGSELTRKIRADDAWASSAEARQVGTSLVQAMARIFGRSAI